VHSGALPECGIAITAGAGVSHAIPQKISGRKDFKLSLRVRKPLKNCTVEILQQDAVIKKVPLKKAIPAEMIQIHLNKAEIKSTGDIKVVVRLENQACAEPLAIGEAAAALMTRKDKLSGGLIKEYTCIICPNGCVIEARIEGISVIALEGAACDRGREYVEQELTNPQRNIATLAAVENGDIPLVSVRLTNAVPKARIFDAMAEIKSVRLTAPVVMGQVVLKNILGLDCDVVSTKNVRRRRNENN